MTEITAHCAAYQAVEDPCSRKMPAQCALLGLQHLVMPRHPAMVPAAQARQPGLTLTYSKSGLTQSARLLGRVHGVVVHATSWASSGSSSRTKAT